MTAMDLGTVTGQLDEIIGLLKTIARPVSGMRRVIDGIATGAGILGIISVVDILKTWLGG